MINEICFTKEEHLKVSVVFFLYTQSYIIIYFLYVNKYFSVSLFNHYYSCQGSVLLVYQRTLIMTFILYRHLRAFITSPTVKCL